MPVRILEAEPTPAIMMIDLALLRLAWIGPSSCEIEINCLKTIEESSHSS
jgi:hypothetical protein